MIEENPIVKHLLQANWSLPDPAWDYATIYERCLLAKVSLEKLVDSIAELEKATPETDRAIRESLDHVGQYLNQTRRLVDE